MSGWSNTIVISSAHYWAKAFSRLTAWLLLFCLVAQRRIGGGPSWTTLATSVRSEDTLRQPGLMHLVKERKDSVSLKYQLHTNGTIINLAPSASFDSSADFRFNFSCYFHLNLVPAPRGYPYLSLDLTYVLFIHETVPQTSFRCYYVNKRSCVSKPLVRFLDLLLCRARQIFSISSSKNNCFSLVTNKLFYSK